eukprot:TRINITY_DN28206_c0_g1_i1.p1 TRINITY_DN28206_c0_g1~~TRINITY_DN28206_c0_g1_i1.p1  ORF type:complete len:207 (+),score=20.08 TRINITY_DN28206_c0_g1_i1:96-716(+)
MAKVSSSKERRQYDNASTLMSAKDWHSRNLREYDPTQFLCPNCRLGLGRTLDCFCGKRPDSQAGQEQAVFRSTVGALHSKYMPAETFEETRDRILKQGQRKLKSQGEYLMTHMGLNRQQVQTWRSTSNLDLSGLTHQALSAHERAYASGKSPGSLQSQKSRSCTDISSEGSKARRIPPRDPVIEVMLNGPPNFSPTMSGLAAASLA